MTAIKCIVAMLVVMVLNDSCFTAAVPLSELRHFPKKPKFEFLGSPPFGAGPDSLVPAYDSIYIAPKHSKGTLCGYMWYRFWPSGQVLFSENHGAVMPTAANADDFTNGRLGFFKTNGVNIFIELFTPSGGNGDWDYLRVKGVIDGDAIEFEEKRLGPMVFDNGQKYIKLRLENISRQPDWHFPGWMGAGLKSEPVPPNP